jgi:tetratricopeptide (TPR) repeat protein
MLDSTLRRAVLWPKKMHKLIKELRRREVFRTAGLYIGVAWIVVEVSSVLFDAFEAPEWALQAVIILAIIGLPVTIVLSWIFDITDHGIEVQAEATDTMVIPFGGRRMDFVVIGVLTVALIFSVYLNISGKVDTIDETIEPLSILIADFDNQTGDPLFEGSLEQALQIGLEGAPFVSSYERGVAKQIATELKPDATLDSEVAQLVATREGIKLVLAGAIVPDGGKFDLRVNAIAPRTGEVVADADASAASKLEVLAAMGELAADLRGELGDRSVDREDLEITETFTAMSLEAAREYDKAQQLQYVAKYEEAIDHYRAAIEYDQKFGRAYSGWAVAARALGRIDEAEQAWENVMELLGTMTERERLRTQGIYYWGVTRNFKKAIETYETLVEKYPADFVGRNNLAVVKFFALDYEGAKAEGGRAVEIYPSNAITRSNYALYAMYSSDFEKAVQEAQKTRELDPTWFASWLPVAMQALSQGNLDAARAAYEEMSRTSTRGASTASLGLADVELYSGRFGAAEDILLRGLATDEEQNNNYGRAVKFLTLAEARLGQGDPDASLEVVARGRGVMENDATLVPAALLYLAVGQLEEADAIASVLSEKLSPHSRAYSGMINGLIALQSGDAVQAIEMLTNAVEKADLWLLRFYLGKAYFEAGYFVEALDEFTLASERRGEATALFLDDLPSYRYAAALPYWRGRAQQELGMADDADKNFRAFLSTRSGGGPLADDARQRLR